MVFDGNYNICEALVDFDNHKTYPLKVDYGGYLIKEVLEKHEQEHKKLFESYMKRNKDELDQKISDLRIECDEAGTYLGAQEKGNTKLTGLINQQLNENFDLWKWETGKDKRNPDYKRLAYENEQRTHAKVQLLIIQYKQELMRLYGSWVWCL